MSSFASRGININKIETKIALQVNYFEVYTAYPATKSICKVFDYDDSQLTYIDNSVARAYLRQLKIYQTIEDYAEANAQKTLELARSDAKRKLNLALSPAEQRLLGLI